MGRGIEDKVPGNERRMSRIAIFHFFSFSYDDSLEEAQ